MDTLSLRRRVAGLTILYKLHYITSPPALAATLPARAIAPAIAPATHRRSAANLVDELQLQTGLPPRTCNFALRSFPGCLIEAWNELPATLLRNAPSTKGMQQFKVLTYCYLKQSGWSLASDIVPQATASTTLFLFTEHSLLIKLPIHNILCPHLFLALLHSHANLSSKLHGNQPLLSPQRHDLDTATCLRICLHLYLGITRKLTSFLLSSPPSSLSHPQSSCSPAPRPSTPCFVSFGAHVQL